MIPLTPIQILCGGWGFLPSPAAVFTTPHAIHPGVSVAAIQWPTGVMEYGLASVWNHQAFQTGAGLRYLGFATPIVTAPGEGLAPPTGTFTTWRGVLAAEAFRLVGFRVIWTEERLTGVYRTSSWDVQGSLTASRTLPALSLRVEGLLQGKAVPPGVLGGFRIWIQDRGVVQVTTGFDAWPHQGGCAATVTPAGWLGAGGEHYPGWGTLWGVGGGLRLGTLRVSWIYAFHPYGSPLMGAAFTWIPPAEPEEERP